MRDQDDFHNEQLLALLRRVATRDKGAFRALYHAIYSPLTRFLYRLLRHSDGVEELVNDVMWVVWEKAAEFRGEARVQTWIFGIAVLKSRRWRQRWYRQQNLITQAFEIAAAQPSDSDVQLLEHGFSQSLEKCIAQLSSEHREAIELAYFCGYSCEEIATIVDCPTGTVKTRLHYARKHLRQLLAPENSTCGDTT